MSSSFQKSNKRVKDEQEFYDYEVFSPVSSFPEKLGKDMAIECNGNGNGETPEGFGPLLKRF